MSLREGDDDLRGRDALELDVHGLLEVLNAVSGDEGLRRGDVAACGKSVREEVAVDHRGDLVKHLTEAADDLAPIDAAVLALTRAGLGLSQYSDFARARRELIGSSPELQERDLIKMASLTSAIAEALRQRDAPARTATLTAQAAMAVFTTAYGDWVDDRTTDLDTLMQRSLADLRQAVGCTRGTGN